MSFEIALQRAIFFGFASVLLAACSTSRAMSGAVPESRKLTFITTQPGNGGCTGIFGCPTGELCWDGSEPDPFFGSCPPVPPTGARPAPTMPPACSIAAATLAVSPPPRNRTTLGVGEQVALTSADGSVWAVNGDGTLDTASGGNVIFTAGERAGTATVSASAQGCTVASVTYTIVAPSGLFYVAVNGVKHTKGFADIGMQANVYLQPDSVSFKGLAYRELEVQATATGPYACLNGTGHNPNPNALIGTQEDVVGYGTPIATDTIESGSCDGLNQFGSGSITINIPETYMVGPSGAQHQFGVVQHAATASAGSLAIRKGAASRTATVNGPTSTY